MASLFGALGSLAESYGLARQRLQQDALEQIRQRVEQQYADIAGQRLGIERDEQQRLREQFEMSQKLQQQEFSERQQEFEWRKQQAQRPQLLDFGFPLYTRPGTNERVKKLFNQTTGEWTEVPIPGSGQFGIREIKEFIGHQDKDFQPYLNNLAQSEVARNPDDPGKAFDKIEATAEKMREEKAKSSAKGTTPAELKSELANLKSTLQRLKNTVGVLNNSKSRYKMAVAGVGELPTTRGGGGALATLAGIPLTIGETWAYGNMTPEENAYINVLRPAMEAIQAMRRFTGLPRSTTQTIELFNQQLPVPKSTANAEQALAKIDQIEKGIRIIEQTLGEQGGTTGAPAPSGAGGIPSVDDLLNRAFGPAPTRPAPTR